MTRIRTIARHGLASLTFTAPDGSTAELLVGDGWAVWRYRGLRVSVVLSES
jgi:hypothetical protein